MVIKTMDADLLKRAFLAGAKNLENNKAWINDLNVFPVPDGDTGTNMTLTILSAVREVNKLENLTMASLAKAMSSGSLRGARGNSGVILSQLFRGLSKEIRGVEAITPEIAAAAFKRATETAYKAVMKPKEGTILTVARCMAEKAEELAGKTEDLDAMMVALIECGDEALARTPDLLPVLKQAGVVDSGGQGLMQVMKGALAGMRGEEIPDAASEAAKESEKPALRYTYCAELVLRPEKPFGSADQESLTVFLNSLGEEVLVRNEGDSVKIHVHTDEPGQVLSRALTYGSLTEIGIENMREADPEKLAEHEAELAAARAQEEKKVVPRKEAGFISVSIGDGLAEILRGLNVDEIIEGGQTMNPSTEDILTAVDHVNADVIYVLPNNSNIILAAEQAVHLVKDKKIVVVPSKTVPQGIAALISYSQGRTPEENLEAMKEGMSLVKTGQVTYAVRDTMIDDREIHEGDIMGLGDKSTLYAVGDSINTVVSEMIDAMVDEESELISLYYGADITEDQANVMAEQVMQSYPDLDVEVHRGGQPIYYYLVSVE